MGLSAVYYKNSVKPACVPTITISLVGTQKELMQAYYIVTSVKSKNEKLQWYNNHCMYGKLLLRIRISNARSCLPALPSLIHNSLVLFYYVFTTLHHSTCYNLMQITSWNAWPWTVTARTTSRQV